jgi:riboflavin-specific deaminase-like protein
MSLKSNVSSLKTAQSARARVVPRPQRTASTARAHELPQPAPSHALRPGTVPAPKRVVRAAGPTSDFRLQTSDLPFVLVNMAMTADGKIATTNRAVASFGSRRDHDHLLELRATADAVMSGARTVDSAKINMGPGGKKYQRQRIKRGLVEFNLRVIVSGSGSIDPRAEVFRYKFSPLIILTTARISAGARRRLHGFGAEIKICGPKEINFRTALRWLKNKWGVQRLLCEGGGDLNAALFRAGLVDELHLTVCPKIFGGRNAPTIAEGIGFKKLAAARQFQLQSTRRVGTEMFLVYGKMG